MMANHVKMVVRGYGTVNSFAQIQPAVNDCSLRRDASR